MRKAFWLLDVNYEARDGCPEVWIWGIDREGMRILLIDRGFRPYFYCIPKEKTEPREIIEEVKSNRELMGDVVELEVCKMRYFGKPVDAVKVTYTRPEAVEEHVKWFLKTGKVDKVLEDDIRFTARYLIDRDLRPCSWYEVEVEELEGEKGVKVDAVYLVKPPFKPLDIHETPALKILAFSVVCYSTVGEPVPKRDPIVIISLITSDGKSEQFSLNGGDEKSLIKSFVDFVRGFDPDIIAGYATNSKYWDYLIERAAKNGVNLYVGRTETIPHRSVYGHMSVTGRINLDLLDYIDEFGEIKVKTLENFAEFLGISEGGDVESIDEMEFARYWDDPSKRPKLLRFSMDRARRVMSIVDKILDYSMQLANIVGIPMDYVGSAAVGFRVEWLLIREARKFGELVPKRVERRYFPYAGGMVLTPKKGLHENIAVLDFKSLYPNIMIKYNISPDTYIEPGADVPEEKVYVAPEVGHRFLKEPPGIYKKILEDLISARDELRVKLKSLAVGSPSYRLYDARQKAIKVITNAVYGYAGWLGARWYIKPVAEAATAWGRYIIRSTLELSKELGLNVIYGDTDSVFVEYDEAKVDKLLDIVRKKLGLELRPDKVYVRVLFTEAKKRYCGLLKDGRLDYVGFEIVRGDWTEAAKKVQEEVLKIILKEKSPDKARDFVVEYVSQLRERKVPLKDLVIWKSITRPIEEYKVNAPHIEAAKILIDKGWTIYPGDKVGYVIISGSGPIYKRAIPYNLASIEDVDIEYYIWKQIVPPVERILKIFGVEIKQALTHRSLRTLLDAY